MTTVLTNLLIIVLCFFFETSALSDNEKAQKYLREAEYYTKKAEGYERDATYYSQKADGYLRQAIIIRERTTPEGPKPI